MNASEEINKFLEEIELIEQEEKLNWKKEIENLYRIPIRRLF